MLLPQDLLECSCFSSESWIPSSFPNAQCIFSDWDVVSDGLSRIKLNGKINGRGHTGINASILQFEIAWGGYGVNLGSFLDASKVMWWYLDRVQWVGWCVPNYASLSWLVSVSSILVVTQVYIKKIFEYRVTIVCVSRNSSTFTVHSLKEYHQSTKLQWYKGWTPFG